MSPRYCGLDFGTSNSTLGFSTGGRYVLCPLEGGSVTLPSSIFFDYEDRTVRFGRDGIRAYIDGTEGRLLRALKSVLGSSLITETTQIRNRPMAIRDIIGILLRHLKSTAEQHLGGEIDSVVLGRPVRFVDDDDAADRQAEQELVDIARAQGFRHIELQFEPVAAALDYEQSLAREELALIVDLGGGTSDFAVTRLSPERSRKAERAEDILGRSGIHIGGTDFDRLLSIAHVMPELGFNATIGPKKLPMPIRLFHDLATWHRIPSLYTASNLNYFRSIRSSVDQPALIDRLIEVLVERNGHRLATEVEAAKITLSQQATAMLHLPFHPPAELVLSRQDLVDALRRETAAIIGGIDRCLAQAGVTPGEIQSVFLTGGSTAIPDIRRRILGYLPNAAPVEGDVFGSVGLGLAIEAERRFGNGALKA
jgi:hypothetical chaperone protein